MGLHLPTAHSVETTGTAYACSTCRIQVSGLRVGDLVFDLEGGTHPLVSVSPGGRGSVWVQRQDLTFREHLSGTITIVAGHRTSSAGTKETSGRAKAARHRLRTS